MEFHSSSLVEFHSSLVGQPLVEQPLVGQHSLVEQLFIFSLILLIHSIHLLNVSKFFNVLPKEQIPLIFAMIIPSI